MIVITVGDNMVTSACLNCGKNTYLVKGYCMNTCYKRFLKTGSPLKMHDKIMQNLPKSLNDEQSQILVGLMLGDGCLFKNGNKPMLAVTRQFSDIEYLRDNFSFFNKFCSYDDVKISEIFDKRTNKIYKNCKFCTRGCDCFESFYDNWYVNGVKVVPRDLKLTPLICAIWFCDDGSIHRSKGGRLSIKLSTHGFIAEDVEWLKIYLHNILNEHFYLASDCSGTFILGSDAAAKSFIKYIIDFMPQSMNRKITWTKEDLLVSRSRPHLKNREQFDFNDKELLILKAYYNGDLKSSFQVAKEINWVGANNKTPSSYCRYLNKFLLKKWLIPHNVILNGKNNIRYSITDEGKRILNEALSINT